MRLFSKENGVILNILNAVLIIWLMLGIVFTVANVADVMIKEPAHTYEEYEALYCYNYDIEEKDSVDKNCKSDYVPYKYDLKYRNNETKKGLIISISNILLSSIVLVLLNKEKNKK